MNHGNNRTVHQACYGLVQSPLAMSPYRLVHMRSTWQVRPGQSWLWLIALWASLFCAPAAYSGSDHDISWRATSVSDRQLAAQQWLQTLGAVPGSWQATQSLAWFGRPLWLRQFFIAQDLAQSTERITQIAPALTRVLTGPDMLLLSGIAGDLHLVVQLRRTAAGVSGLASALDISFSPQAASGDSSDLILTGLLQVSPVHVSQWRLPDGIALRQSIYVVPQGLAQVGTHLRAVLAQQGWQEIPAITGEHGAQWQRRADRLHLMPAPDGQGSLLYQILMN